MGYNETIYGNSYLLGRDVYIDGKHRIENIAFDKYLRDLGLLDHTDIVHNLAVVWYVKDDEQYVQQIYNHDTGEIYFDEPTDEWTDEVDEIVSALLMYGNLEQIIA